MSRLLALLWPAREPTLAEVTAEWEYLYDTEEGSPREKAKHDQLLALERREMVL